MEAGATLGCYNVIVRSAITLTLETKIYLVSIKILIGNPSHCAYGNTLTQ